MESSPLSQSNSNTSPIVPPELLLSAATPAVLLALVGAKLLTEAAHEIGVLSEELFRGERLPVLTFPTIAAPDPDSSENP